MRVPEVLAPAGDEASMRAAVRAGADAVYFGLQGLNARARAKNFDVSGLAAAMRMLHEHAVRGLVTINTLVFDDELRAACAAIEACADAGVDAIIVQDLAVMRLAREISPALHVHASTQMTCTDAASVRFAGELGARRVVLARELTLEQIEAIARATDVELEVFVHGALCVAYSGQCLTSEAIGGRSANRGACAQACRLPYELVVDGVVADLEGRGYLLSPMDLEASRLVPKLAEIGVSSLKIEGRLKGPEYVYAATRLYRAAVDALTGARPAPSEELRRAALQTYSRGSGPGFLEGIDHQRLVDAGTSDHRGLQVGESEGNVTLGGAGKTCIALTLTDGLARGDGVLVQGGFGGEGEVGGRVWEIFDRNGAWLKEGRAGDRVLVWLGPDKRDVEVGAKRRVFRTDDPRVDEAIRAAIEREPHRAPLELRVRGSIGVPATIEARSVRDGRTATVTTDAPIDRARKAPTDDAALRDKLGRLGETPFELGALSSELPPDAFLPVASLNRARRELAQSLAEAATRRHARNAIGPDSLRAETPTLPPPAPGIFVLCRSLEQAQAAVDAGADGIILDFLELTGTGEAFRSLRKNEGVHVTLTPPRVRKPDEEKIDRYLEALGPDAMLVRTLGALSEPSSVPRVADFSLNVTNRLSAGSILSRGAAAFTPSFDLDQEQLLALLSGELAPFAEVVVHHPMPLFYNEHCLFAALLSDGRDHKTCGRPCEHHTLSLRDRAGMDHPVIADVGCRNTVFHARSQSAAQLVPALTERGVARFRVELVREDAGEVRRVVDVYRRLVSKEISADDAWSKLRDGERALGGYGVVRGSLRVLA